MEKNLEDKGDQQGSEKDEVALSQTLKERVINSLEAAYGPSIWESAVSA